MSRIKIGDFTSAESWAVLPRKVDVTKTRNGKLRIGNRESGIGNRESGMGNGNGEWRMENGEWRMWNGE